MSESIICILKRISTSVVGTFGTFDAPELGFSCISLELPDRNNTPMISRIPAGIYPSTWLPSLRFKRDTYRLTNPPGRAGILIHPANFAGDKMRGWESELSGCIALGQSRGSLINKYYSQQSALMNSAETVRNFELLAAGRELRIHILNEDKEH